MAFYKNTPLNARALRKQVIVKRIPILAICLITGIGAFMLTAGKAAISSNLLVVVVLAVLAVFVFNTLKEIKRETAVYNSYSLTIADEGLVRQQKGLPIATVPFSNIEKITEAKQGHLIVKMAPAGFIIVPSTIEGYPEVKELLNAIKPINSFVYQTKHRLMFLVPLACIALMAGVYLSTNKAIVLTSGIILAVVLSWSFYKIKTNNSLDSRTKRSLWSMPIILLSIIAIVYYKVFMK